MSKLTLIPFRPSHLSQMKLREWDTQFLNLSPRLRDLSALYFEENGFGFTGVAEEGFVGAAGVVKVMGGNFETWVYTTDLFNKYGLLIGLQTKRFLDLFFSQPNVFRIQALVDSTYEPAVRWVEKLQFEREGKMNRYGPKGQDFYMYAKVKK